MNAARARQRSNAIIARVPEWPRCKVTWTRAGVLAYTRMAHVLYRGDAGQDADAAILSLDYAVARVGGTAR